MAKLLWIEDHQVVDGFSGFRFSGMFIVILSTQIPQSSCEYRVYGMQNSLLFHRYLILIFLPNSLDDRFASEDRRTRNQLGSALHSNDSSCLQHIGKSFASHEMMKHMTQLDFSSSRQSLPSLPVSRSLPRSIPTALPSRQLQRLPLISRL